MLDYTTIPHVRPRTAGDPAGPRLRALVSEWAMGCVPIALEQRGSARKTMLGLVALLPRYIEDSHVYEGGRPILVFTQEQICDALGCARPTLRRAMDSLPGRLDRLYKGRSGGRGKPATPSVYTIGGTELCNTNPASALHISVEPCNASPASALHGCGQTDSPTLHGCRLISNASPAPALHDCAEPCNVEPPKNAEPCNANPAPALHDYGLIGNANPASASHINVNGERESKVSVTHQPVFTTTTTTNINSVSQLSAASGAMSPDETFEAIGALFPCGFGAGEHEAEFRAKSHTAYDALLARGCAPEDICARAIELRARYRWPVDLLKDQSLFADLFREEPAKVVRWAARMGSTTRCAPAARIAGLRAADPSPDRPSPGTLDAMYAVYDGNERELQRAYALAHLVTDNDNR